MRIQKKGGKKNRTIELGTSCNFVAMNDGLTLSTQTSHSYKDPLLTEVHDDTVQSFKGKSINYY